MGIDYSIGVQIIVKIGDFKNFDSTDKILTFVVLFPSIYQSGKFDVKIEKWDSRYLKSVFFNATYMYMLF